MSEPTPKEKEVTFKRSLTLSQLIFYGVGTILGLGIYVLLGKVAGEAGKLAPFAFIISAIIAGFTALSYGELCARIPKSAGEVHYVNRAFKLPKLAMLVGWLIVISGIISTATVVNGYVGYVQVFFDLSDWVIMVGIILILTSVAIIGIRESVIAITLITILEVSGLIFVIVVAGDNLNQVSQNWSSFLPSASLADWNSVFMGAFLAFFAFIGFEDMVNVAEEAKDPERDMSKAIIISLIVLTLFYVVVALVAVTGLSTETLNQSDAPLADILASKGEQYPKIISGIGLIAIVNGVLVQIVMIARVMYGMAKKKMAPTLFGVLNSNTRTPATGTLIISAAILILALWFQLESLAKATNYILLLVFIMVHLSLWKIKLKDPEPEGIRTFGLWVPIAGFLLSLGIFLFEIIVSL